MNHLSNVKDWILGKLRDEPVVAAAVADVVAVVGVTLGLELPVAVEGALVTLVTAILVAVARSKVTPVAKRLSVQGALEFR